MSNLTFTNNEMENQNNNNNNNNNQDDDDDIFEENILNLLLERSKVNKNNISFNYFNIFIL